MDGAFSRGKDILSKISEEPAMALGIAGGITAVASWAVTDHYQAAKTKGDPTAAKRAHQADIAMTIGWTLLASSLFLGGIDYMKR